MVGGNVNELEMLERRGRILVIFSELNISVYWANVAVSSRKRYLQFGTNLIVFSLAQRVAGMPLVKPRR